MVHKQKGSNRKFTGFRSIWYKEQQNKKRVYKTLQNSQKNRSKGEGMHKIKKYRATPVLNMQWRNATFSNLAFNTAVQANYCSFIKKSTFSKRFVARHIPNLYTITTNTTAESVAISKHEIKGTAAADWRFGKNSPLSLIQMFIQNGIKFPPEKNEVIWNSKLCENKLNCIFVDTYIEKYFNK